MPWWCILCQIGMEEIKLAHIWLFCFSPINSCMSQQSLFCDFIKARLTTHFVWALTSPLIQIGNRSASQEKDRAVYSSQTLLDLWCSAFLTLVQYTIWSTSVMSHLVGEEEHRRGRRKKDIKTKTHISTSQINGGCQTLGKLPPKGISRFITSFLSGWIQPSKTDHGIQNVRNMKQKTTALVFIAKNPMSS